MTTRLFSLILTLFAIVSNADFLRYEDGSLETVPRFKRCLSCEDARWRPPPYFYHHHHGPHFYSQQWSGTNRSPDGYRQQVFSGAAASADSDTQNSGGSQAFSLASSSAGSDDQDRNIRYQNSQNQVLYSGYGNKDSSQLSQASSGNHGQENQQQQKQDGFKQLDYINHGSGAGFGNIDSSSASSPAPGAQPTNKYFSSQQQYNHGSYSGAGYGNKENAPLQPFGNHAYGKQDTGNKQQQNQFGFKQSDYNNNNSGVGFTGNIDSSSASSGTQQQQQQFNHGSLGDHKENGASHTFGAHGSDKDNVGNQQQQKQFGFKQSDYTNTGVGFSGNIDSSSVSSGTQATSKPDFGTQQQQQQFNHGSSNFEYGNKENVAGIHRFDKEDVGSQQQQNQFGFKHSDYINHGSGTGYGNVDSSIASSHASSGSQTINKPDIDTHQHQQQFNHESSSAGYGNKENVPTQTLGTQEFGKQNLGTQQQFGFKHSQNSGAKYENGENSFVSSGTQNLGKHNLDNTQQQQQNEGPNSKDSWETLQHQHRGNLNTDTSSYSNNGNLQSQTSNSNNLKDSSNKQQHLSLGGNGHYKEYAGSYSNTGRDDKNNLQSTEGYDWFVGKLHGQSESQLNNGGSAYKNTESEINHGKALESKHFGHNQEKSADSSFAGTDEQRPTTFGSGSFQSAHNTNQNWNKNYHTGSLANTEAVNDEQQIQQQSTESFGQNKMQSNGHSYDKTKTSLSGALSLASQGLQASDNSNTGCSTCNGKESIAYSNAKSHSGSAIAVSVGGK